MTPSDLRWRTTVLLAICWCSSPIHSWAEMSLPIPRTSTTTEQRIREEVRYLQEETISVVVHRDQLVVHPPLDSVVTSEKEIQDSGTTDYPTWLRQEPNIKMVALGKREFIKHMQGNPAKKGRAPSVPIPRIIDLRSSH